MNERYIMVENTAIAEKYYRFTHESGLRIFVIPKPFATTYALFGTRYGSIDTRFRRKDETDFVTVPDGIAHYLEHKMFENEDGVDTFARFAETGASANAFTSFDMTAYLFSCTEQFDKSLEILLDYVTHPYFTEETVKKEQGIIAQEIRMGEDNPSNALLYSLLGGMYRHHPIRREIAGSVESIAEITPELLYRCYRTFYNLRNMALCVCGDVTPEQVEKIADRVLVKAPPFDVISEQEAEPETVVCRYSERHMELSIPIFAIGIKDINISDDPTVRMRKTAAMTVLDSMLFGQSGSFFNELYRDGLISGPLDCWEEHNRSFSFIAVNGEGENPQAVFDRFLAFIEKTKQEGLCYDDFLRSRRALYASVLKSYDSTSEIANNFLGYIFDDGDMLAFTEIAGTISFAETQEIFRDLFREEHYAFSVVYPIDSKGVEIK